MHGFLGFTVWLCVGGGGLVLHRKSNSVFVAQRLIKQKIRIFFGCLSIQPLGQYFVEPPLTTITAANLLTNSMSLAVLHTWILIFLHIHLGKIAQDLSELIETIDEWWSFAKDWIEVWALTGSFYHIRVLGLNHSSIALVVHLWSLSCSKLMFHLGLKSQMFSESPTCFWQTHLATLP